MVLRSSCLVYVVCWWGLVLGLGVPPVALAQGGEATPVPPYIHRAWTTENGLPQNSVFALVQTHDGYLWLGTLQGLVRFDGIRFTVFEASTTDGLLGDRITALLEARNGDLWIATAAHGLTRYRNGVFTTYTTAEGLPSNSMGPMGALVEDDTGAVWVVTDRGLARFKDGGFATYTTAEGLPSNRTTAVYIDQSGDLWVGMNAGVARRHQGAWTVFTTADGLIDDYIWDIIQDRDGTIWVGTVGGISRFEAGRFTTYPVAGADVFTLYEDRAGYLWACAAGRGLLRFHGQGFERLTLPGAPLGLGVIEILEDREGLLWVGTNGQGLHRLKAGLFTAYSDPETLPGQMAHGLLEDHTGAVWAGSFEGGLARFAEGNVDIYTVQDGLPSNKVWAVAEDGDGRLWIGTDQGLARFDGRRFVPYLARDHPGLGSDVIFSLARGRDGSLLIGTDQSSISRYRDGQFHLLFNRPDLAGTGTVLALYEDRDGVLWFGTRGGGLGRFENEQLRIYTTRDGLSHNTVRAIHEAPDGALWLGTYGGGLCAFKDEQFNCLTRAHGLPDNTIHHILEDDFGYVWLPSNKGIFRVPRAALERFFRGEIQRIEPDVFGTADGMSSSECNGGFQPAGWKARDGRLWFPTTRGPTVIDPARVLERTESPFPVYVEELLVDGVAAGLTGEGELAAGSDRLVFRFTGLYLGAPEKLRFRHRLDGHDLDWIEAGTNRTATYTNLPPGAYTFYAQASLGSTGWSEPAVVAFRLQPHFYQTAWFQGLMGVMVLGLIGAAGWSASRRQYRRQLQRLQAQQALERERNRISRDMHDEVGASLTEIAILSELAQRQRGNGLGVQSHLEKIASTSRAMLDAIGEIIWAINPENDRLDRVVAYLREYAAGYLENTPARLRLRFPQHTPPVIVSAEFRRNVFLVLKETLHNLVKHAKAREVCITLRLDNHRLDLHVEDNGCGFDSENGHPGGNGLRNMAHRAEEIGGMLAVDSVPAQGTRIHLSVPLTDDR